MKNCGAGVFASLLGFAVAFAAPAAAGSIAVAGSTGRDSYAAGHDGKNESFKTLSTWYQPRTDGAPTGSMLWYNPIDDAEQLLWGDSDYTAADADWARANLRLYDIYRQLGGNSINLDFQFMRTADNFYVGIDGLGGEWYADYGDAKGHLFRLMVSQSAELDAAIRAAVAAVGESNIDFLLAAARDAAISSYAVLARGQTTAVTLTGDGFSDQDGTPFVLAPPGVRINAVTFDSAQQLTLDVSVDTGAATGDGEILVFNPGGSFSFVERYAVLITAGTGLVAPLSDDHGGTRASATPVEASSASVGEIETAGDRDLFTIVLAAPGTLALSSGGPTDVAAALEGADGAALGGNDDGGEWYNFSLTKALDAGTYFVRVSHCCQGTGVYTLSAAFTAD